MQGIAIDPLDHTEFNVIQTDWTENNLPDVSDLLQAMLTSAYTPADIHSQAPANWQHYRENSSPLKKTDAAGNLVLKSWPEPGETPRVMRQFDVLPDQVRDLLETDAMTPSSQQQIWTKEDFAIETWLRLEPSAYYSDINMRMYRSATHKRPGANVLNNRCAWFRKRNNLLLWHYKRTGANIGPPFALARNQEILQGLPQVQVALNTTAPPPNFPAAPIAHVGNFAGPVAAAPPQPANVPSATVPAQTGPTQVLMANPRVQSDISANQQTHPAADPVEVDQSDDEQRLSKLYLPGGDVDGHFLMDHDVQGNAFNDEHIADSVGNGRLVEQASQEHVKTRIAYFECEYPKLPPYVPGDQPLGGFQKGRQ